jgi:RimJ/RimL family protein N-acetyltransferase
MMEHLGGPETLEKVAKRQARYEQSGSRQYKITVDGSHEGVGWVGYWPRTWRDTDVYEIGWSVRPEFQGRGIASRGTALALQLTRADEDRPFVHAFPAVDNGASNAICRKLGFALLETALEFEYPPGNMLRCNDWRLDLTREP